MDNMDYRILAELERDAALTFVDIARKIGTTPSTVRRRYEKMKKDGVIFRSIVSINLAKLGYEGKVFLMITTCPNSNKSDTVEYLKKINNIIVVTEIIGPCDLLAIGLITDLKSIQNMIEETKKAPGIEKIEFSCIDDVTFPIGISFGALLSEKAQDLVKLKTRIT